MAEVRPAAGIRFGTSAIPAAAQLAVVLMNLTAAVGFANPDVGHQRVGVASTGSPVSGLAAALVPGHGALWGSWVAPVNGQSEAQAVAAFESKVRRRLDIVHQYHAWDEVWPTGTEYGWAAGGRIIFGNVSARQRSGALLTWTQIASGSQDSIINGLAARLKAFGRPIFLSFDEEPEGRYHSSPTAYSLASFVGAYRHIHSLFAAHGATNVVWVWNVTGYSGDEPIYRFLYPGDSYVDWIGWDPYNWFNCSVNTTNVWQKFDTIVAPFYNWVSAGHLSAGAARKPYMLAEYGTVEHNAAPTKGQWFTSEVSSLPNRPKIKAVVYFNENKDCSWPVTSSSSSTAGFTAAGLSCYVNRAVPSAPKAVSAKAGDAAAVVSWTKAGSVCPVTTYTVIESPGGKRVSVSGGVLSATVGGLANRTAYTFELTATSVNGTSGVSVESVAVTPLGPPGSPSPVPSAQPSEKATPVGSQPTGQDVGALAAWLEANVYVIPIFLVVLLGAGFGAQFLTSRSRRKQRIKSSGDGSE